MHQEKRSYDPVELATRLVKKPIDVAETREGIAQSLAMRWSQAHLSLESFRLQAYDETELEGWILNHKLGRAFYHYIFACHWVTKIGTGDPVKPSLGGFEAQLKAPPNKLKSQYHRMMNDWLDHEWIDADGVISEDQVILHMVRCFQAANLPALQSLNATWNAFMATYANEERDREENIFNVFQLNVESQIETSV